MNASPFFDWLVRTSWQASILVLLVLAAQWPFRRRLNARWHYALWLLVVARLAMPSLPASSWSIFNVVRYPAGTTSIQRLLPETTPTSTPIPFADPVTDSRVVPENITRSQTELPHAAAPAAFDRRRLIRNAEFVWLAGLLLLAGRALGQNIVFMRRLRTARAVTDSETLALFAQCKEIMRVSGPLPLAETDRVHSPALYGFIRPTLLLPLAVMGQFSAAQKRHIFLHELAHVKRRDMAVHWVATVFRLLHWFNPVLWFGFQRMAADRELACDELALGHAGEDEARPYGETVLKLLELCARPAVLPGLMGILEEKSQMTRRILRIARYKQQTVWPIAAMLLLIGLGLVTLTDAQNNQPKSPQAAAAAASKPDLVGKVHLTNGQPVMATIFIATAGPKVGTSTFCPSCYADCIKSAKADAQGRFKIESLDPTLIFRVLVVAKDCQPKYVVKVDPTTGPVDVTLERRNNADSPPGNTLLGRVVDSNGVAIAGAAVESDGIHHKDGSAQWGALGGVDPLAVTDERGEFVITSRDPFASLDVKVEARAFARKTFTELASGRTRHDLVVTDGASVSGRVTWNEKPLPGVSVGVVSVDRTPEQFTGNYEVGTDSNGRFTFVNLPPNVPYYLYGIMETVQKYGAAPATLVSTGGDGSSVDTGDLAVRPALRISGRVILDDGAPIPAKTRLLIGPMDAWDTQHIELDKDGRFAAEGMAPRVVSMSLHVPGYQLSRKNESLDRLNFRLVGRLSADVTNMTILLEKGARKERDSGDFDAENRPEDRPLRGIEGGPAQDEVRSEYWTVGGLVTDAKSGRPVANFSVTPGTKRYQRINFDTYNQATGSNGAYSVTLSKRFADPRLKIEADGYLPAAVTPPQGDTAHFDVKLEPGTGPSGMVLTAEGKPATNVTVGLISAGTQAITISGEGELQAGMRRGITTKTGDDGSFSFPPELEMQDVAAASPQGFKLVSISNLAANPKIVLEPWGRVSGTLRRPSGPGTNEDLDLDFSRDVLDNPYSLQPGDHAITDAQGRFEFDRVPPGKLDLTYRVKMSQNGWMPTLLQTVTVTPGQTLELKIDAGEREAQRDFANFKPRLARRSGPAISGNIFLPGGKPAAGILVALRVPGQYLGLGKAELQTGQDKGLETTTDDSGHFTLPGVEGAEGIFAVGQAGFAKATLPATNSPALTLEPWGEIHGTLRAGRRLGANQAVEMTTHADDGFTYDPDDFKTQADDQGRFVFTYVPPGPRTLARVIPQGDGSWTFNGDTTVDVKPGAVTDVTVGGTGREIIGKSVFPNAPAGFAWKLLRYSLRPVLPSDSGSNYLSSGNRYYAAETVTNSSFVFEDVPPGTYDLWAGAPRIPNGQPVINNRFRNWQSLGGKEVTIPEAGSGGDAEPCDVGTLKLRTVHPLNVGDAATPIEAETPEGRKFQLADYRGRFVLLNILFEGFELPSDLPQMKEAFEAFGRDDRLAMLSVTYAPAPVLKEFARTNGIAWMHGSLGNRYSHSEFEDYLPFPPDVNHSQLTYLIDPDGKIVAKDLHGAAIKEAVAKVLARN
jgi:beta-lactamase regulating signal transducer with metallopeptidase domain